MQNHSGNFSIEEAAQLAASPAGQKLFQLLQQADSTLLQNAMNKASGGDLSEARQALEPLLASDEIQKLLKQLGG